MRRQRLRNFWTIQFFSRGVPMTVWGDEFGRTQNGNNNAYNIDSVVTWNNYEMIATHHPTAIATGGGGAYHDNFGAASNPDRRNPLFRFAAFVAGLRRAHPCLRQRKYGDWLMDSGEDVTYQFKRTDGETDLGEGDRCIWLRIDGSAVGDHDFLLLINMDAHPHSFRVPAHEGQAWARLVDTAAWAEIHGNFWGADDDPEVITEAYEVAAWSIGVLEQVTAP